MRTKATLAELERLRMIAADRFDEGKKSGEIAEFLRHLARFRSPAVGGDPADQAALLVRKAELFARIADQHAHAVTDPPSTAAPTTPTTPEGRTP